MERECIAQSGYSESQLLPINKQASHKLVITALDEGVVLDQVILY